MSVVLDEDLRTAIAGAAEATHENAASIIRKALRAGLPMLQSTPEHFFPDPDLRADVGKMAELKGFTRARVLLEAVKIGLPAMKYRFRNKETTAAQEEALDALVDNLDPLAFPLAEDVRRFRHQAARERIFRETVARAFPECAAVFERVEAVLRWAQGKGKPLPVVYGAAAWIPKETLEAWEAEMMREAGAEAAPAAAAPSSKAASTETAERPRAKTGTGRSGRQR